MKASAFNACLILIASFTALAFMAYYIGIHTAPVFFGCSAFVFLMLLPSCSKTK